MSVDGRISTLEKGMLELDRSMQEIKYELKETTTARIETDKEVLKVSNKVDDIVEILIEMKRKKISAGQIALIVIGLIIAGVSAFAAIKNNELSLELLKITQAMVP